MAPQPQWFQGATPLSSLSFPAAVPGVATAAQVADLWNDKDGTAGADPIRRPVVRVFAVVAGSPVASGDPVVDRRAVQIRVRGGLGGLEVVTTGWQAVGANRTFSRLPAEIASTEGVALEVRVLFPAYEVEPQDVTVHLALDDERSTPLAEGFEHAAQGILHGIGDDQRAPYFWKELTLSAAGPADDTVTFGDAVWLHGGKPRVELTHVETFNALDGAAATITGAESYYVAVSYGSSLTLTKGLKGTPGTKPAAPAGELLWGWILVSLTASVVVIESADIEQDSPGSDPETMEILSTSGLDQTYSGAFALVDGFLTREKQRQTVSHADAATESLWRLPDGTLTASATRPDPRALELWEVTAAGAVITGSVDRRSWIDHQAGHFEAQLDATPVVSQVRVFRNAAAQSFWLRPSDAIEMVLYDADPSALGNVSGRWAVDVERLVSGSWVSIFTSSGTDDRRPEILFSATSPVASVAVPEVLEIAPGQVWRVRVVEVPASAGAGLSVSVRGWYYSGGGT